MQILNFEAFIIAITILTITPGLDTAIVIRNTTRAGIKDGSVTSLGICTGLFVHATFSAIGISAILLQSAQAFQVMKWVGAVYLIYLGLSSIKTSFQGERHLNVTQQQHDTFLWQRSLREGFLSNVLNPKAAVFYLAFLPQFIDPAYSPLLQSFFMATVHFAIAMIWQCGLAAAINFAKRLFQNNAVIQWMEAVTGMVLIVLGVKLLLEES